ncbi:MAG: hypothetical protein ABI690_15475 [Chloroflexota bacterium]
MAAAGGIKLIGGNSPQLSSLYTLLNGNQPELSCRTQVPVVAAIPRPAVISCRNIVRKSPLFGHKVFAYDSTLFLPFWKFPSSTTKTLTVLENSRNIQKNSAFLRIFFWMGFRFWKGFVGQQKRLWMGSDT